MKKYVLLILLGLMHSFAFAEDFIVKRLQVDIYLQLEGDFDVVETYDIEFLKPKHGIIRDIITQYTFQDIDSSIRKRIIYIDNIQVPGLKYQTNQVYGYLFSDILSIKIGDKNKFIDGHQKIQIQYNVKNALIFTNDEMHFYWNIKSSEWWALFQKIDFHIHFPEEVVLSPENCFTYAGNAEVSNPSEDFEYDYSNLTYTAKSSESLNSYYGQSVTTLIKIPRGIFKAVNFEPTFWKKYRWLIIFIGGLISVFILLKMIINKRNKVVKVTSYYPPKGMDPAMAGMLIDNKANMRDITCLLPYWGAQGVIKMENLPKDDSRLRDDLKLIKLKDLPNTAAGYERNLFRQYFTGRTEVLISNVGVSITEPMKLLSDSSGRYYPLSKFWKRLKITVAMLSWIWAFFSISFLPFVVQPYIDIDQSKFIVILILNYLFFFIVFPVLFAAIINKLKGKNEKGKAVMSELLGFYEFIKIAETRHLKSLLKEDPYYFEKTMPYAVAFNLLKEWTAKFEGLILHAPSWYSGSQNNKSILSFSHAMNNSLKMAQTPHVNSGSSSHSSSGGGRSGGGFGGGGGRSW